MRALFIIITLLGNLFSYSQMISVKEKPSFYLGKRVSLDANFVTHVSTSPQSPSKSIDYDVHDTYASSGSNLYLHKKGELKTTIGLSNKLGLYAKWSPIKRSRETSDYFFSHPDNSKFRGVYEYGQPLLKGNSIGFGVSYFLKSKASLAPMGTHVNIGFSKYNYKVTHNDMFLTPVSYSDHPDFNEQTDLSSTSFTLSHTAIDIEYVMREPITKYIYYNLSFQSTINLGAYIQEDNSTFNGTTVDFLIYNTQRSFLMKDIAMFKIGLGAVLF